MNKPLDKRSTEWLVFLLYIQKFNEISCSEISSLLKGYNFEGGLYDTAQYHLTNLGWHYDINTDSWRDDMAKLTTKQISKETKRRKPLAPNIDFVKKPLSVTEPSVKIGETLRIRMPKDMINELPHASESTVYQTEPVFTTTRYEELVEKTIATITELARLKGGEYSGDFDRLANFRAGAKKTGVDYRTIWFIYADKHWTSIERYVNDVQKGTTRKRLESLAGRADDLIVYLLLFKAMLLEQGD